MDIQMIEQTYLAPLKEQGYFVTIFGEGSQHNSLIIDCSMYFTDTDEGGGPANPICHTAGDPCRDEGGHCVACENLPQCIRSWGNGSVMCPFCRGWTKPWTMQQRNFRAIFQLLPDGTAIIQERATGYKDTLPSKWISNPEMIQVIADALAPAAKALSAEAPDQRQMSDASSGSPKAATSSSSSPKAATSSSSSPKAAQEVGEAFPMTEGRLWAEDLIQTLCAFGKKRSD